MSRSIGASNITAVEAQNVHEIVLAKIEFDTPVYVHSGIGSVVFDGDTYLGVGDFGNVREVRESESLGPNPFELTLSGIDSALLAEGLNAANFGDVVTVYAGYRLDDGTLVADPWQIARGRVEYPSLARGDTNSITLRCQHDLAVLDEIIGAKYSDEDQVTRYIADTGFEFVEEQGSLRLFWGGRPHTTNNSENYDEFDPRRDR